MRRNSISLLTLATSVMACTAPQVDMAAELEAVRARSAGIVAAESAMDIEGSLAFWAPDGIVMLTGAPLVQGTDNLRILYGQFFNETVKSFGSTTTHTEVSQSGDMAWEYGVNRLVTSSPDGDLLDLQKYIATWRKIDGEWFVAAVSVTSDAPAPVPTEQ